MRSAALVPLSKGGKKAKRQWSCSLQGVVVTAEGIVNDNPLALRAAPFVKGEFHPTRRRVVLVRPTLMQDPNRKPWARQLSLACGDFW